MSYFPDLLIETYHLLNEEVFILERTVENIEDKDPIQAENIRVTARRLLKKATEIKKRMKSLGYHDCWGKDDNIEVAVP